MNLCILPFEIVQMIFSFLDLRSQLNFKCTCELFYTMNITNFWDLGNVISPDQITNAILCCHPKIERLNLYDNRNVCNINFLENLTMLNIGGFCLVGDDGIANLENLIYLNVENNYRVTVLANKKHIKYLDVSGSSVISDAGISHLDLKELRCIYNDKITTTSHFKNLRQVYR